MKWLGHDWKAGQYGWPEHGHYYPIVSASMTNGNEIPLRARDAQRNNAHAREAQFVEESTRDRVIKLWNATRHLDDDELDKLLNMLEGTKDQFATAEKATITAFSAPHIERSL